MKKEPSEEEKKSLSALKFVILAFFGEANHRLKGHDKEMFDKCLVQFQLKILPFSQAVDFYKERESDHTKVRLGGLEMVFPADSFSKSFEELVIPRLDKVFDFLQKEIKIEVLGGCFIGKSRGDLLEHSMQYAIPSLTRILMRAGLSPLKSSNPDPRTIN